MLQARSIAYHILGVPTSLKTTQLLYRSTSQTGNPTVNVTSVIQPLSQRNGTKVISYQSAYDSLNRNDEPSYAVSGGFTLGGVVANVELAVFGLFLADGYTVIVPDTHCQRADFAAGAAMGGVLVHPARNLLYVEGSYFWAGVMPMALSVSRARSRSISRLM